MKSSCGRLDWTLSDRCSDVFGYFDSVEKLSKLLDVFEEKRLWPAASRITLQEVLEIDRYVSIINREKNILSTHIQYVPQQKQNINCFY